MNKLFIPPTLIVYCILLIILFYFLLPEYNLFPFPFNFGGIIISLFGFMMMGKAQELFKKHKTTLAIQKSSKIITDGLFSKTRNPMYLGMFILLV